MISDVFDYERPVDLAAALAALARHGDGARVIAGGHSLLPMMKLRLAGPEVLIDINALRELHGIEIGSDEVVIGAATTHATLEHHAALAAALPLIPMVAHQIADPTVRNRGTLGGSLAHADPSADWPAVMLVLGARVDVAGSTGARSVAIEDFFKGMFETALEAGEVIVGVRIARRPGTRVAYRKFRHPASGYAVVGVAVVLDVDQGRCTGGRIAITGFADRAFLATRAQALLPGYDGDPAATERLLEAAFSQVAPLEDRFADADYRTQLGRTMLRRALNDALAA